MYINIVARLILVLGGLFYLVQFFGIHADKNSYVYRSFALIIGLCALYFIFDRDYYLPFLGKTVIPIISSQPTENLKEIALSNLPPDTRIIYWAAKPGPVSPEADWRVYNDYSNSGVSKTDIRGNLVVKISCPVEYNVPSFFGKRRLRRHLHYRYEIPGYNGMFSRVYTKYIDTC